MFLFIYLHGDDPDFNIYLTYLKSKTECLLVEKYTNYTNYLKEKEGITIDEENYKNEKATLNNSIDYIKYMKNKLEDLTETKNKVISQLKVKIDEKEFENEN